MHADPHAWLEASGVSLTFMHAAPSSAARETVMVFFVFFEAYANEARSSEAFDASGASANAM